MNKCVGPMLLTLDTCVTIVHLVQVILSAKRNGFPRGISVRTTLPWQYQHITSRAFDAMEKKKHYNYLSCGMKLQRPNQISFILTNYPIYYMYI